jgi:hypothetical protein
MHPNKLKLMKLDYTPKQDASKLVTLLLNPLRPTTCQTKLS